jgi:UDP-N-acetylmuramoylalanine--D-glutamate ligase
MVGVVAIGDDAPLIAQSFDGICPVVVASDMKQAVALAANLVIPGASVLLSPGCTSYDWYRNYNERGEHFTQCVLDFFAGDNFS